MNTGSVAVDSKRPSSYICLDNYYVKKVNNAVYLNMRNIHKVILSSTS